jgi:signal transduction histidine kinase
VNWINLLNPARDARTEAALFELARRNVFMGIISPIIISLLMMLGFGDVLRGDRLALWLALMALSSLHATYMHFGFSRLPPGSVPKATELKSWRRHGLFFITFTGMAWGAAGLLFVPGQLELNMSILLIYLGVAAGAVTTHGSHSQRALMVGLACSGLAMYPFLSEGFGAHAHTLGLLLFFYLVVIAYTAFSAQKTILHSLQLQFENEALIQEKAIAVQKAERERIYQDLHDDVGAKLLGLAISAQRTNQVLEADLARSALQDLRDVVSRSAHSTILLSDLIVDLRAEAEQRIHASGLLMEWQSPFMDAEIHISSEVALHLSRILREAVTNVLRHAGAKRITLLAQIENENFVLVVEDDGKGCPATNVKQHRGMKGMRARASVLNASLQWENTISSGCRVNLVVPLGNLSGEIAG